MRPRRRTITVVGEGIGNVKERYLLTFSQWLIDVDPVLELDGFFRIGALRLRTDAIGPFLAANQGELPPLIQLAALLRAIDAIHGKTETATHLRFLLGMRYGGLLSTTQSAVSPAFVRPVVWLLGIAPSVFLPASTSRWEDVMDAIFLEQAHYSSRNQVGEAFPALE